MRDAVCDIKAAPLGGELNIRLQVPRVAYEIFVISPLRRGAGEKKQRGQ
jgi:hypothetical protein